VIVSDVIRGGLYRVHLDSVATSPESFALPGQRGIGGAVAATDGGIIATGRDVRHVAPRGDVIPLLQRSGDLTGFNDICASPEGGLLVGALRIVPAKGELTMPADIIHVAPDGSTSVWSSREMTWPNGIALTPDGSEVYVADFASGAIFKSSWAPGERARLEPWAVSPAGDADGLSVDLKGRVWVALGGGGGIGVYGPQGDLQAVVDLPASFVSSVCHAGPDGRTLVATTLDNTEDESLAGSVFAFAVDVPGAPRRLVRV
jgi:sugar lactone lactonase YvrE